MGVARKANKKEKTGTKQIEDRKKEHQCLKTRNVHNRHQMYDMKIAVFIEKIYFQSPFAYFGFLFLFTF